MDFYDKMVQNTNVADAFFACVDAETPIVLFGAGFALKSILYRFEQNGFTNISMYPKLMETSGLPYAEQLSRLIELALARHAQMEGKQRGFESGSHWFA